MKLSLKFLILTAILVLLNGLITPASASDIVELQQNKSFTLRLNNSAIFRNPKGSYTLTLLSATPKKCRFFFFLCDQGVAELSILNKDNSQRYIVNEKTPVKLEFGSLVVSQIASKLIQASILNPTIESVRPSSAGAGDIVTLHITGIQGKNPVVDFAPDGNVLYSSQLIARKDNDSSYTFSIPDGISPICTGVFCPQPLPAKRGNYLISFRTNQGQTPATPFKINRDPSNLQFTSSSQLPQAIAGRDYTFQIHARGATSDTIYELVDGNLPQGLTLTQEVCKKAPCTYGAKISGRPAKDLSGDMYPFTIEARSKTQKTSQKLSLNLLPANSDFVQVLNPTGTESFAKNSTIKINWDSQNIDTINITLVKGNAVQAVIADGIKNTKSYSWTIPDSVPDGNNYSIHVRDAQGQIMDSNTGTFSIAEQPFQVHDLGQFRDDYDTLKKPQGIIHGTGFDGSNLIATEGFKASVKIYDLQNRDVTNKYLDQGNNLAYSADQGGWPFEFKRTVDSGIYLIKSEISCGNGGFFSSTNCSNTYGSNSIATAQKTFTITGNQNPQLTGLSNQFVKPGDRIQVRGLQLAADNAAIMITSDRQTTYGDRYTLARLVELRNLGTDTVEFNIPSTFHVIPFHPNVDLQLINLEAKAPISSNTLSGEYLITFINRKGISNPLSFHVANNSLSWVTGYQSVKWGFPAIHVFEWLTTNPSKETSTPRGVSIFLEQQQCYSIACQGTNKRITVARNTQNDGAYEWNGVDENGVFVQDGVYRIILVDANNPSVEIVANNTLTINSQSLIRR